MNTIQPTTYRKKISVKEKILFARQLGVLIKAGIPLHEALNALMEQVSSKNARFIITKLKENLEQGRVLGESLLIFPRAFDPFFVNMVRIGEESGTLPGALDNLANQMEKADEFRRKITGALMYPVIILVGTFGVGGFLAFIILPKLIPVFYSLQIALPPATRALIFFTKFLQNYFFFLIAGFVGLILLFIFLIRITSFRYFIHAAILKFPIFGQLMKHIQITRFARSLSTLLKSGIPLMQALEITGHSISNMVYAKELRHIQEDVRMGGNISNHIGSHKKLFPPLAAGMLAVGEETGSLPESCDYLADFYEKEMDRQAKMVTEITEPILLIVMGLVVGFIAISIISPIYSLTSGLSK